MINDLAALNGREREASFPFWERPDKRRDALGNIKPLPAWARAAVKALEPHPGGNDLLFGLHKLDITNLLRVYLTSGGRATMSGPWTHETSAASAARRRRNCGDARSS